MHTLCKGKMNRGNYIQKTEYPRHVSHWRQGTAEAVAVAPDGLYPFRPSGAELGADVLYVRVYYPVVALEALWKA